MKYRVGRKDGKAVTPAFDVEQITGGGIRFSAIRELSDSEHTLILAHYGRSLKSKVRVLNEQHLRMFKPGTDAHFRHASYVLPSPFQLLPRQ